MINYNKQFWNKLTQGYYDLSFDNEGKKNSIQHAWHYLTFKKQKEYLISGQTHLDYACGPGTLIGQFSKSKSLGFDPATNQIKYAISTYSNKNNKFIDNYEEIQEYQKFNILTINGLFEYLTTEEIKNLINQLVKFLHKDAKIIITTPNYSLLFRFIEVISKLFGIINYGNINKNKYSQKKLENLFKDLGFKRYYIKKILNIGVLFSFINFKFAVSLEENIENRFNKKFGFLLMAEIHVKGDKGII